MSVFFPLQISLFFFFFFENQFLEKLVFKTSFFNHPNTLYFSGPTYVWGFFVLVQNFDRLCGEKARNGSTGPTDKPRCPANVRYRKLGMGLKMDKFKKKKA